jgi:hypothetical protein
MADYDNTDKGAAFKPFDKQKLILQGKINDDGNDRRIVLIKDETKTGKTIIGVFEQVGTLFPNEKKETESAPDYTGPLHNRRLAAWRRSKEGNPYMTFALSNQQAREEKEEPRKPSFIDDDQVPW